MISSSWDQRATRAAELEKTDSPGGVLSAAADLLRFYTHVARQQQHTFENLPAPLVAPDGPPLERLMLPENLELLRSHVLDLVFLVRERGPAPLAGRANEIARASAERMTGLLVDFWRPAQDELDRFLARAIRSWAPRSRWWTRSPFCRCRCGQNRRATTSWRKASSPCKAFPLWES